MKSILDSPNFVSPFPPRPRFSRCTAPRDLAVCAVNQTSLVAHALEYLRTRFSKDRSANFRFRLHFSTSLSLRETHHPEITEGSQPSRLYNSEAHHHVPGSVEKDRW